jgi:ribosome recycling factor
MAYGNLGPLKNIASVSIMDASTIVIQPWDRSLIKDIEKGISDAKI